MRVITIEILVPENWLEDYDDVAPELVIEDMIESRQLGDTIGFKVIKDEKEE